MKLKYWICLCNDDSNCYSIRTKTKKEAVKRRSEHFRPAAFDLPKKVEIEYANAFELMLLCSEEDRNYWEF